MAKLPNIPGKVKPFKIKLLGINTETDEFDTASNELLDSRSVNNNYNDYASNESVLSVIKNKVSEFGAISTPNCLGQRNNQEIHVLDGTAWKKAAIGTSTWTTLHSNVSSALSTIVEFSYASTLYTILANSSNVYSYDGTTATSIAAAPQTPYYTSHAGRLYALKGKQLSYSALNNITDWSTAMNAGTISLSEVKGEGTGITSYMGSVICFTEFSTHELWGTGPLNYELKTLSREIGCVSNRSIIEHKRPDGSSMLYWLGRDGKGICLYEYGGGKPRKVLPNKAALWFRNVQLNSLSQCCIGSYGDSLFISVPSTGYGELGITFILEYNTKLNQWYPHEIGTDGRMLQFVTVKDKLYSMSKAGNKVWTMFQGDSNMYWYANTKFFRLLTQKLTIERIDVVIDLPSGSTMNLGYTSTLSLFPSYTTLYTFTASSSQQMVSIPLKSLQNLDWVSFQFIGYGPFKIYDIVLIMTALPYTR